MIVLSDIAKEKLIDVLLEEQKSLVRFGVKGGGCAGFSYYFLIEDTKEEDDFELPLNENLLLLVDAASMMYVNDISIDYKEDLMGSNFIFKNPSAQTSCGCGSSFSANI